MVRQKDNLKGSLRESNRRMAALQFERASVELNKKGRAAVDISWQKAIVVAASRAGRPRAWRTCTAAGTLSLGWRSPQIEGRYSHEVPDQARAPFGGGPPSIRPVLSADGRLVLAQPSPNAVRLWTRQTGKRSGHPWSTRVESRRWL